MANRHVVCASMLVGFLAMTWAQTGDAEACMPPYDPPPQPTYGSGIVDASPMVPGTLARDGGLLLRVRVNGITADQARAQLGVSLQSQNGPVPGTLRVVHAPRSTDDGENVLLHYRTDSDLPTGELDLTLDYARASGANDSAPKTFSMTVGSAKLRDHALPKNMRLVSPSFHTTGDASSPRASCFVKGGAVLGHPCGGQSTVTSDSTRDIPTRAIRRHTLDLEVEGEYRFGADQYFDYEGRFTSTAGEFQSGISVEPPRMVAPFDLQGTVCWEVTARSAILDDFEVSRSVCLDLEPAPPLSEAEQKEWFSKQTQGCTTVNNVPPASGGPSGGTSSSGGGNGGGCNVASSHSASTAPGFGALAAALFASALRRRSRR